MGIVVGGMCNICCHMALVIAFMRLFLSILFLYFFYFFLSGIETPEQNWQWYQHPPALFAIFTEGTNFVIMLIIMFYGCKMCMFRLHSFYVGFDLVTSPELTVRLTGLYKSIHK